MAIQQMVNSALGNIMKVANVGKVIKQAQTGQDLAEKQSEIMQKQSEIMQKQSEIMQKKLETATAEAGKAKIEYEDAKSRSEAAKEREADKRTRLQEVEKAFIETKYDPEKVKEMFPGEDYEAPMRRVGKMYATRTKTFAAQRTQEAQQNSLEYQERRP